MGKNHSKAYKTVFSTDMIHFSTHLEDFLRFQNLTISYSWAEVMSGGNAFSDNCAPYKIISFELVSIRARHNVDPELKRIELSDVIILPV